MKRPGVPRRRRKPAASKLERELRLAWKAAVGRDCQVCYLEGGLCSGPMEGHHVVSQEALKRRALADPVRVLWDRRNKLDVCRFRHEQHTSGYKRIPFKALPLAARVFAVEHGLGWWVERFYV